MVDQSRMGNSQVMQKREREREQLKITYPVQFTFHCHACFLKLKLLTSADHNCDLIFNLMCLIIYISCVNPVHNCMFKHIWFEDVPFKC